MYGAGFEYLYSNADWRVDTSLEWLGMTQHVNSFSETTGQAAQLDTMTVHDQNHKVSLLKADANISYNFNKSGAVYLKLGVLQDLDYKLHSLDANVRLESVNFTVQNPGLEKTRATSGLGLRLKVLEGLQFNADGSIGTDGSFSFGSGIRYSF
jgi:hypothetical protein